MSTFLFLLKYSRNIGNLYKHTRINDVHTNFRSLSHISSNIASIRSSKSATHIPQYIENKESITLSINDIIQQMDDHYKKIGIIPKHFIERIIQHVDETAGKIETLQALLIFRCNNFLPQCMPQERIKLATTLWELLNTYHVPVDISHYNALLQIYIENGHEFHPLNILSSIKRQGILPNSTTYKYLLQYYCKNGNMSSSAIVLECMKEEKCPINESIFNLLILGYSQAGDLARAISIPDVMKKMGIDPSEETYTAIMCAYAKKDDINSIKAVLSTCKKKGMKFSNQHMLDVIYTLYINNNMHCHPNQIMKEIENCDLTAKIYFLSKIMDTKPDIAMEVIPLIQSINRYKSDYTELIYFFLIKLISSKVCSDKIIEACIHFETKYNDRKIFPQAIYYSFQCGSNIITLDLLKAWQKKGHELRPHYFWPVLTKLIEQNNIQDLLHIIKEMITTYHVIPCVNTVKNFFIPYIFCNIYDIRNELHKHGVPRKIIDNAIVCDFLQTGKMRRAASYITMNKNIYQKFELKDVLIKALHDSCDVSSFVLIVTNLYEATESGEEKQVSLDDSILDIMNFLSSRPSFIPMIIKYLYDNQLQISNDVCKVLSQNLPNNLSSDISKQLAHITKDSSMKQEWPQSQEQIQMADSKSELMDSPVFSSVMSRYKRFLVSKEGNNVLPHSTYIYLLDSLFQHNLREEAKTVIKHLVTYQPSISTLKLVLNKARYLISLGYFNDAAEIIEHTSKVIKIKDDTNISLYVRNLLTTAIDKCNEEEINNLFNILSEARYLLPSENLLHPLMTIYIQQGDAIKALETAELLCDTYQYIPGLTKLTKLIVLAEDINLLQRFIDITTKVYELQYILGELLLCFLENDYEKEAKRTIELFITSNYKFTSIKANILKHIHEKNTTIFLKLLDYTEVYADMDRLFICKCLFDIYNANNDYQSGLQLWARMTKEGMLPTQDIALIFENLVERNNVDKSLIPN